MRDDVAERRRSVRYHNRKAWPSTNRKRESAMRNWSDRICRVVVAGTVAILAGSVGVGMAYADAAPKVTICHLPPGNPGNVQLITVGAPAVPHHVLQHGDAVCASAADRDCCADQSGEVCTNVQNDQNNCGECGNVCARTKICSSGVCQCPPAEVSCSDLCVDPASDPQNCGGCGHECPTGTTCVSGACSGCPVGSIECNGACVDPASDPRNCGACGNECPTGDACVSGTCGPPIIP